MNTEGFFEESADRGDMPEHWAEMKSDPTMARYCDVFNKQNNGVMKSATTGQDPNSDDEINYDVEVLSFKVTDQAAGSQEAAKSARLAYSTLMNKYAKYQTAMAEKYLKTNKAPKNKQGVAHVYIPFKPAPYKIEYRNYGPKLAVKIYPDFALHHNIAFEKLKLYWNIAVAYAKRSSDRKPLIAMMQHMFAIPSGKAKDWAYRILFTGGGAGPEGAGVLNDRITWMGWNLVEGPASGERHDDPGTRFDDFEVNAMPPDSLGRIRAVKALDAAFKNVANMIEADGWKTGEVTIKADEAKFDDKYRLAMNVVTQAVRNISQYNDEDFIPFNPAMWIFKPKGSSWRFEIIRP